MPTPNWVEIYEGKFVGLTTRGQGGERVYRGMRKIERVGLPGFMWAAITEDRSDVIDLSLANDPMVLPVEDDNA